MILFAKPTHNDVYNLMQMQDNNHIDIWNIYFYSVYASICQKYKGYD